MQAAAEDTEARQGNKQQSPASQAPETLMPSEVAKPTRSNTEPQQASTQPDDGSRTHDHQHSPDPDASEQQQEAKISWKDQVLGYAKVTRGKVLGKQETQEAGHKILQGEIIPEETRKSKRKSIG